MSPLLIEKEIRMDLTFLSFGHGYTAQALTPYLNDKGWRVFGTSRTKDNFSNIEKSGATPILWGSDELRSVIRETALVLSSVSPANGSDPVIKMYGKI